MWPLRSNRQQFLKRFLSSLFLRPVANERYDCRRVRVPVCRPSARAKICSGAIGREHRCSTAEGGRSRSCELCMIVLLCVQLVMFGVVKPHGRLGPVRLEGLASRPRLAYRRRSLRRPFRELKAPGEFILGRASHLDAFSGYHSRSSLPGAAPGGTTGTRADRPTRSSRTRVRPPQPSTAHDGYRPNCLTTF